jgi:hypothetical protein
MNITITAVYMAKVNKMRLLAKKNSDSHAAGVFGAIMQRLISRCISS